MLAPSLNRKTKSPLAKIYGKHEERYLELLNRFPLRPIRNDDDLDLATEALHELIDQVPEEKLNKAESDYLDVLTDLVEAYESVHHRIEDSTDSEMLAYLIEIKDATQSAVAKGAGIALSTISEVLSGKRQLTRSQIGKISRFFNVDPGVFSFDR